MLKMKAGIWGVVAGVMALTAGCRDESSPAGLEAAGGSRSAVPIHADPLRQDLLKGPDLEFIELARTIPGFGGFYFDRSGTAIVYLTNLAQQSVAEAVLTTFLARQPVHVGKGEPFKGQFQFRQGQFDFLQLSEWRARARDVLFGIPGVVTLDVNETRNRLVIRVRDAEAREAAQRALAEASIPSQAVAIEEGFRVQTTSHTLSDRVRPVMGGLQVWGSDAPLAPCTLGFNAYLTDQRYLGLHFVANSHCSQIKFGRDYTPFSQSRPLSDQYIGYEVYDPPTFPCSRSSSCRWSDATLGFYDHTFGTIPASFDIARTEFPDPAFGSHTIDHANPYFSIVNERAYAFAGERVDKVGMATGWTYGDVIDTCEDIQVETETRNDWLLCQQMANYGHATGDSGSPVFHVVFGTGANLVGLHWGAVSQNGVYVGAAYSPMQNVEADLGKLDVYVY